MHRNQGRRPGVRIRMMNSFSKFTNTADNPVDLDEEMSEDENAHHNIEDLVVDDSDLNSEEGIQNGAPKSSYETGDALKVTSVESMLQDLIMDDENQNNEHNSGIVSVGAQESQYLRVEN